MHLGQRDSCCNHLWQPILIGRVFWQHCLNCDQRKRIASTDEILADRLKYVMTLNEESPRSASDPSVSARAAHEDTT